ncbi:TlpA disulfide reductase family protein [Gimesia sp.]|uniref:TlpA family protein disulfide reductase n=1 Tax=Gimesia sp. TaxID=2024833 RepID=UPI000C39B383|nr:TlpA disulfide reductase family protein [Gimesia sp.]MAX39783.1 redoxin [Gimesia sp.]HAH46987.1 TlpA family protein disulfide reductase [Planctomycetaceae bacterium]HBL42457.1 TlpA family protein disulfide reductase [Planctomycetaceae bacterium]|tara:strand:+ start:48394 stop:49140 length:747 start_codon:yes stop_codon:yes gene_type:complete
MSIPTYNSILFALQIGAFVAICVMIVSFFGMIIQWTTPRRGRHVLRLLLSLGIIAGCIVVQQSIFWGMFMPTLREQQLAEQAAGREKQLDESSVLKVGDPAPEFTLTMTDDKEFSMSEARGDVVLINFFATWCGPCRMELPHIQQIWEERKDNPRFRLLVIGREETMETVKQFCEENGFTFPAAPDPDRVVFSMFAHDLIPRTLVISPEGTIIFSQVGFSEPDVEKLEALLDEQLAGLPVPKDQPIAE